MADPLADALLRAMPAPSQSDPLTANSNVQKQLAAPTGFSAQNLLKALTYINPATMPAVIDEEVRRGTALETGRTFAGQLARMPTDVVGGFVALPALADIGLKLAGVEGDYIPGAEGSAKAASAIHDAGRIVGETIAGKPLTDNVLYGTPVELASNWVRTLAGAVTPAPAIVAAKLGQAKAAINSGNALADSLGRGMLNTLEVLSPLTVTAKPSAKVMTANAAVAGTLSAALDGYIGPQTTITEAKQQVDEKAKGAFDAAAAGIEEAERVKAQAVQAGIVPDSPAEYAAAGLAGAAALMYYKRGAVHKAWNGVRTRLTGYDQSLPSDKTDQSFLTQMWQDKINDTESLSVSLRKLKERERQPNVREQIDQFDETLARRRGASVGTRMQVFANDGRFLDSTVKTTPLNDIIIQYRGMPENKQSMARTALIYEQELNNRQTILKEKFNLFGGAIGSPGARSMMANIEKQPAFASAAPYAHHLPDTTSTDMMRYISMAKADRDVSKLMAAYLDVTTKARTYMGEQKFRTRSEVKKMAEENPSFVPTRMAPGESYMKRFDQAVNGGFKSLDEFGDPFHHLESYMSSLMREVEGMKTRRDWITEFVRASDRGDTVARRIIGRDGMSLSTKTGHGPGPQVRDSFVEYRDAYGNRKSREIKDAVIRDALKGTTNPTALQLASGAMSTTARLYEQGAVGAPAALTGGIFAPMSLAYNTTMGMVQRPKGIAMGRLDKFIQEQTKKLSPSNPLHGAGLRVDPTFAVDLGYAIYKNIGAVTNLHASKVLHNSILTDGNIAKMFGPTLARKYADDLYRKFNDSMTAALQQDGIMGPASFSAIDPAKRFREASDILESQGVVMSTGTLINDLLHAVSAAPGMALKKINQDNPKQWKVNHAIRNLTGDVGQSGAFRKSQSHGTVGLDGKFVAASPWGNIAIQSVARHARAWRRDPVGTAAGITGLVVVPSISSVLWSAAAGPEYLDYHLNQRSPDKAASSWYIAVPGRPPEEGYEFGIDPLLRGYKYMSELLSASQLGAFSGILYDESNADMLEYIKELAGSRWSAMPREGTITRSIIQQSVVPPMPPIAQLGLSAAGVSPRSYDDVKIRRDEPGKYGFQEGNLKTQTLGPLSEYIPGSVEDMLRSIGAQATVNVWNMGLDTSRYLEDKENNTPWDAARKGVARNIQLKATDSTRMLGSGPLFDAFMTISPSSEASAITVNKKLEGIKQFAKAYDASTLPGGAPQGNLVGDNKRGYTQLQGATATAPQNELTAIIGQEAKQIYSQLSSAYLGAIGDAYAQRQSIQASSKFAPEEKRYMLNEQSKIIIDANRRMLQDLERFERIMSKRFGMPIKFDELKLGEGVQ